MSTDLSIILLFVLFLLLFLSSIFSSAETAYSSINVAKIQIELKKQTYTSNLLQKHIKSFGWTLATILIGNNLVNVCSSVLISYILGQVMSNSELGSIISIAVVTPIIVIFGEIIPKLLARKYSFGYLKKVVYIMEFFKWLFLPFTLIIKNINLSNRITNTEDELKQILLIGNKEGVLQKGEATLASRALDLDSKKVLNIFTKKSKIIYISKKNTWDEMKQIFKKTGYSRLPFFDNGEWIGVINLKDIIFQKPSDPCNYVNTISMISKHTILTKALEILRLAKCHIAFVTTNNKSKTIIGIITMEDILEELVGEIYDEYDISKSIRTIGFHKWIAKGDDLMKELGIVLNIRFTNIKDDTTIYQWLSCRLNRNIKKGLSYVYKNKIRFKVIKNSQGEQTVFEIIEK